MTRSIKIALIGAGFAGQAHAYAWKNASIAPDLADVEVVLDTIVDPNLELAESVQKRYGFRAATADIADVLHDPEIEAVSVAAPNFLSADIVRQLVAADKHVLCEKPLGKSAAEARELADLEQSTDKITAVNFSYRRIPSFAGAQKAVQDGRIGTPYFARAYFYADYAADPQSPLVWRYDQNKSGGGAVIDMGAHVIDAVEAVLGDVTDVISADYSTVISERPLPGSPSESGAVTNEDTALISLRHDGGALASIVASRVTQGAPCELGFEVFGSEGHVSFTTLNFDSFKLYEKSADAAYAGARTVIAGPDLPYFADISAMPAHGVGTGYNEAFVTQVQIFLRALTGNGTIDTTFAAAAKTMDVIEACRVAAETRASVPLSAPATV